MKKKNMFEDYISNKTNDESQSNEPNTLITTENGGISTIPDISKDDGKSPHLNFPKSILPWTNQDYTIKLVNAGYNSLKLIATATPNEISVLTGINQLLLEKLIENAKSWEDFNFETAAQILTTREAMKKISTGSKALDLLLGGGVETNCITEFYGSFTSGKTQLSMQLAVNVASPPESGGMGGYAVYIDTEGSFRPERITQMCQSKSVDTEVVLNRIFVGRAHNTSIQMQLANSVVSLAKSHPVKLLIVDSLTSNFRSEYIGKSALLERQQKLNQHIQQLSRIADLLDISVVVTNQVMSIIDGFEGGVQAVGGNILAHGTTHRVELSKSPIKSRYRQAKLIASPSLPEKTVSYQITDHGISDTV